jgi:hypothetical protein
LLLFIFLVLRHIALLVASLVVARNWSLAWLKTVWERKTLLLGGGSAIAAAHATCMLFLISVKICWSEKIENTIWIFTYFFRGDWVAQWVRWLDLTTHTSLSPIRRGFAPGCVNYKNGCTRLIAASDKVDQLLAMVGGPLRLPPPLKRVAMI